MRGNFSERLIFYNNPLLHRTRRPPCKATFGRMQTRTAMDQHIRIIRQQFAT